MNIIEIGNLIVTRTRKKGFFFLENSFHFLDSNNPAGDDVSDDFGVLHV